MSQNVYKFHWSVKTPKLPGCANDGEHQILAKTFDEAYTKLKKYLEEHWGTRLVKGVRIPQALEFEVYKAERILYDVRNHPEDI